MVVGWWLAGGCWLDCLPFWQALQSNESWEQRHSRGAQPVKQCCRSIGKTSCYMRATPWLRPPLRLQGLAPTTLPSAKHARHSQPPSTINPAHKGSSVCSARQQQVQECEYPRKPTGCVYLSIHLSNVGVVRKHGGTSCTVSL